ncbi:MAG: GGDEF domain-containing protein [Lachnospiraceae bacterium]|nr:GGDEF domain-containing protein [Lachnospiraceae bacterium]
MICNKRTIALCTSRIFDSQTHPFIKRLNKELQEKEVRLLIYAINYDLYWNESDEKDETYVYDLVPYESIDLLILMDEKIKSHRISKKIVDAAGTHSVPVVVIDGEYEGTTFVGFDYEKGFEQIVRHVIEDHGAKKVHMVAGIKGNVFSDRRIRIFQQVAEENGIPFSDDMVSYGEFWATPARRCAHELIDSGNIPEAVICANDIMAINVSVVLQENGLSVPEDVIVTGFDGFDEAKFSQPPLSTINCKTEQLAETVAQTALRIMNKESVDKKVLVIPEPDYNCSCGCTPEIETGRSRVLLDRFNDHFYRYQDDMKLFHDMSERMQMGNSPTELAEELKRMRLRYLSVIVNQSCFAQGMNYFAEEQTKALPEDMFILYNDYDTECGILPFKRKEILPDLAERFESGMPLIFNALVFMHRPMGYICYSFPDYEITDYSKTASVASTISIGIGGYINIRYQQYLAEKVATMYRNDLLTGLLNRVAFSNLFRQIRNNEQNAGKPLLIIMADLDRLKMINDNFGHDAGDLAIKTAAKALRQSCPEEALCLRYGGDELLAVIIGDYDAEPIIEKIEEYLKVYNRKSGLSFQVILSCGAYRTELTDDLDFEAAVRCADEKMYERKRLHKKV